MIDSSHCQRFFVRVIRTHASVGRSSFINVQTNGIYTVTSITCFLIIPTILVFSLDSGIFVLS